MTGVPKENSFVLANGDVLALTKDSCRVADHIDSVSDVYIDGRDAGDTVETQKFANGAYFRKKEL